MKLLAGQRFKLHDEDKFIRLKSGVAEVYAVTHLKESFRQIFLMELPINGAAYPSLDEFVRKTVLTQALNSILRPRALTVQTAVRHSLLVNMRSN